MPVLTDDASTPSTARPTAADRDAALDTVTRLGWLVDRRDWPALRDLFGDTVFVDYTELSGGEAAATGADELIAGWRTNLSGLDATSHVITMPLMTLVSPDRARVTANVVAGHRRAAAGDNPLWTVTGTYDIGLTRATGRWIIDALTLHVAWTTGNAAVMAAPDGQR